MSINLRGCLPQQLNALLAYLFIMYSFMMGRFSDVGAHGITGGSVGGNSLFGQVQVVSLVVGTPEFEHCVGLISQSMEVVVSIQDPAWGKSALIRPRSMHVSRDK